MILCLRLHIVTVWISMDRKSAGFDYWESETRPTKKMGKPSVWHLGKMALWSATDIFWLVVDLPLRKIWTSIGMIIPYYSQYMENNTCSRPPTSLDISWWCTVHVATRPTVKNCELEWSAWGPNWKPTTNEKHSMSFVAIWSTENKNNQNKMVGIFFTKIYTKIN